MRHGGSVAGVPVPPRSADQRRDALARSARARQVHASVKRELKSGGTTLPAVLRRAGVDEAVASLRVLTVLSALPGHGPRRAVSVMDELGIASSRRLRGLGLRQRAALERHAAARMRIAHLAPVVAGPADRARQ